MEKRQKGKGRRERLREEERGERRGRNELIIPILPQSYLYVRTLVTLPW